MSMQQNCLCTSQNAVYNIFNCYLMNIFLQRVDLLTQMRHLLYRLLPLFLFLFTCHIIFVLSQIYPTLIKFIRKYFTFMISNLFHWIHHDICFDNAYIFDSINVAIVSINLIKVEQIWFGTNLMWYVKITRGSSLTRNPWCSPVRATKPCSGTGSHCTTWLNG